MHHGNYQKYMSSRRNGFGVNLYRNIQDKKIAGVCSGIGDHFEIDHNIMRVIFVAALIFTGPIAFWSYIAAWIILVPKSSAAMQPEYEYDENERRHRPKKMFRYRESTSERLRTAKERLRKVVERVDNMEQHVTSHKFNLNRQFADLEK